MARNSVKLYTDNVLTAFYDAIKNNTLDHILKDKFVLSHIDMSKSPLNNQKHIFLV